MYDQYLSIYEFVELKTKIQYVRNHGMPISEAVDMAYAMTHDIEWARQIAEKIWKMP